MCFLKLKTSILTCCFVLVTTCTFLSASDGDLNLMESEKSNGKLSDLAQLTAAGSRKHSKSSRILVNSWKPYVAKNSDFEKAPQYFLNMNAGLGLLYFSNIYGGNAVNNGSAFQLKTVKPQSRPVYNKSPLIEASAGWNIFSFMSLGVSLLSQNNVYFSLHNMDRLLPGTAVPDQQQFQANIDLNAVLAKSTFGLPYSVIWRTVAYTPYLALSVGPCWQTWSNIKVYSPSTQATWMRFRQKISANCFFGSEAGLKLRSVMPNLNFSLMLGCKFNIWGQARSMGKLSQQKGKSATPLLSQGYLQPWKIKTVYQWAPFIGFNLDF